MKENLRCFLKSLILRFTYWGVDFVSNSTLSKHFIESTFIISDSPDLLQVASKKTRSFWAYFTQNPTASQRPRFIFQQYSNWYSIKTSKFKIKHQIWQSSIFSSSFHQITPQRSIFPPKDLKCSSQNLDPYPHSLIRQMNWNKQI
jgi:hypothetical protein